MLEKSRSLFQRVVPKTPEEISVPAVKKARGFDAVLADIKKRQEREKSLQLFDSPQTRDEDMVEQISLLKWIKIKLTLKIHPKIRYLHLKIIKTRSLGALRALSSGWRLFRPFDFVLRALWALRPCDPRVGDWIGC